MNRARLMGVIATTHTLGNPPLDILTYWVRNTLPGARAEYYPSYPRHLRPLDTRGGFVTVVEGLCRLEFSMRKRINYPSFVRSFLPNVLSSELFIDMPYYEEDVSMPIDLSKCLDPSPGGLDL